MGIWKEIKYALNSTLGTKYFMPLNEMVNRELVASNNRYFSTNENYTNSYKVPNGTIIKEEYNYKKSILVRCNGTCYIKFIGEFPVRESTGGSNWKYFGNYYFFVTVAHKDGTTTEYSTSFIAVDYGDKFDAVETDAISINLKQGDTISFRIKYDFKNYDYYPTYDFKIESAINLYAKEVPFSLLKVEE